MSQENFDPSKYETIVTMPEDQRNNFETAPTDPGAPEGFVRKSVLETQERIEKEMEEINELRSGISKLFGAGKVDSEDVMRKEAMSDDSKIEKEHAEIEGKSAEGKEKKFWSAELVAALNRLREKNYLDTSFEGRETHPLLVRPLSREKALDEYLKGDENAWVWDGLQDTSYRKPEAGNLDVVIMKFNKSMSNDELAQEMSTLGVRPLTYGELIQYGIEYPSHQEQNTLVAANLNSHLNGSGVDLSPELVVDKNGRRGITASSFGYSIGEECRFLVVPK